MPHSCWRTYDGRIIVIIIIPFMCCGRWWSICVHTLVWDVRAFGLLGSSETETWHKFTYTSHIRGPPPSMHHAHVKFLCGAVCMQTELTLNTIFNINCYYNIVSNNSQTHSRIAMHSSGRAEMFYAQPVQRMQHYYYCYVCSGCRASNKCTFVSWQCILEELSKFLHLN